VSSELPTVAVVDNDDSVRESLEMMARAAWRLESFRTTREIIDRPRVLAQSCLLLNTAAADLNGLELRKFIADRLEMPVIFLGCHGEAPMVVQAMKAGAFDFLAKPIDPQTLKGAIEHALAFSHVALRRMSELQMLRGRYESLSPREKEVMSLVVSGLLNKVVGAELGISEITVKQHRGKVMRKMRAKSLPNLVLMAEKLRAGTYFGTEALPERTPSILGSPSYIPAYWGNDASAKYPTSGYIPAAIPSVLHR
jgi:FixJ family two-component response regulator